MVPLRVVFGRASLLCAALLLSAAVVECDSKEDTLGHGADDSSKAAAERTFLSRDDYVLRLNASSLERVVQTIDVSLACRTDRREFECDANCRIGDSMCFQSLFIIYVDPVRCAIARLPARLTLCGALSVGANNCGGVCRGDEVALR
jgi:hypothetical protein